MPKQNRSKKRQSNIYTGNALKHVSPNSPVNKINLFKSTAAVDIQKLSFTSDNRTSTYDQEVVVLNSDDLFGGQKGSLQEQKQNMFGLAPAVKAARYDLLSAEPELDDILERMVDECIVFDSDSNQFCDANFNTINKLKIDEKEKLTIQEDFKTSFDTIYYLMAFNGQNVEPNRQDIQALMREYLVRGRLAWEIVYDDINNPTSIIGFKKLNAFGLTPMRKGDTYFWEYDKSFTLNQLNSIWDAGSNLLNMLNTGANKVRLLDSQVLYLQWNSDGVGTMSYLERLVRAFNLLRIMERSRIAYATTASRFRTQITIPTKGKTKAAATETLRKAMNRYHERIEFDDQTGELQINGSASIPFNSEIWFAETNSGRPSIDNIGTGMPDLSDTSAIEYFRNNLQRLSKLPLSRFDDSGGTWNISAESIQRDERRFAAFINKIMTRFGMFVIIKAVWIQMCMLRQQYIGDNEVMNALQLTYNKYNQFQTQMELELLQNRIDVIERLKDSLKRNLDIAPGEKDFWSTDYLIQKYLNMPKSELELNAKMLQREDAEKRKFAMEQAKAQKEQEEQENDLSGNDTVDDLGDGSIENDSMSDEPGDDFANEPGTGEDAGDTGDMTDVSEDEPVI